MSKRIQGITIEIDGDTTNLNKSLKALNAPINAINSELKNLNQALKLDPGNTDLLSQKQEVLKRNIEATTEKLNALKEAQRQMGDYNSLTDQQKESYNKLSLEIAKSENALKSMNGELKSMNKIDLTKVKDTLKNVGNVAVDVVKKMAQVTAAVSGALTAVVGAGVKSYAELEKSAKGAQRLFGDSFKDVEKNASNAYKTLGLSASDYYDQVNTYAVGLKNALGGDSKAAAELSNSILTAQADIVAATGASADAVSNAFSAVMRGNYTLIDNLRLGIKGSKEGMQEVIDKVNEWNKEQGNATNYQMGNYADMQKALVDYVKMQGIAESSQKQLSTTIQGSLTQTKAALDNFLNGSGSPEQLAEVFTNLATNISNAIIQLAPNILTGLATLLETLIPQIASMLFNLLPTIFAAITNVINKLLDMVSKNKEQIKKTVSELIKSFVTFVTQNIPTIIELGLTILLALASGIAENLPEMIPAIVECIVTIITTIIEHLPEILACAGEIIIALGEGLIKAIPILIKSVPKIIGSLAESLIGKERLQKIGEAASGIMGKLKTGITEGIPNVIGKAKDIVVGLYDKVKTFITETDWLALGKNILKGILNGMLNFGTIVKDTIKKVGKKITNSIKDFFGISSPAKEMYPLGEFITAGIGVGIEKGIPDTIKQVKSAMVELNNGIDSSLNPTINPTANTNPLIIQIENFNNTRNQDVQALAEELEFYRKNSALARGGN